MIPTLAIELRKKINAAIPEGRVVPAHTENEHFYKDSVDGEVYPSVTTKTSLLSRAYYKQLAADKAVEHIQSFLLGKPDHTVEELVKTFEEARQAHAVALTQAGDWGTEAHDIVDKYVSMWIAEGKRPRSMTELIPRDATPHGTCGALSAKKFFDEWTLFPVVSEKKVVSKKYKYAGTLDSFFLVGHEVKEGTDRCNTHEWEEKNSRRLKCTWCKAEVKLVPTIIDWKTSNVIFGHGSMGKYEYAMQVAAYSDALGEVAKVRVPEHWIVRLDKGYPHYEIGLITDIKKAGKMFRYMSEVSDFARSQQPPVEPLIKKKVITLQ